MRRTVAVVGRPNVGKSTFFNKIAGRRISIVDDTPGVTRDRIYADCEWLNHKFTLIDTGGIEPETNDDILMQMREQAMLAIDTADVILFMIDGRVDLTNADLEIAEMLRKSNTPVIVVCTKLDSFKQPEHFYNYYELGFGDIMMISAVNMMGLGDLLDLTCSYFKDEAQDEADEEDEICKVAIVGKPNAGKSSLVNKLLGEERTIVSPVAGTTREAIDVPFEHDGNRYILIDTAGIRRKSRVNLNVEKFSVLRSYESIERCDVCVIMIDAAEGVSEQDKKIAGYAHEAGKASIIAVNKWDLIEKDNKTFKKFETMVRNELAFMQYAPILFISVQDKIRLDKLMQTVDYVNNQAAMRVPTGTLNDVISDAMLMHQPPSDKGKRLKLYYMTQIGVKPPTFALFLNDKELAHFSYMRYIENQIRANFNFEGTPIVIELREKNRN
ncbi:MAG: ribosome biogenesis GTPase Der [Bacillota bacterium]|nr:ribosome biogenesis GTPase Der [Bacillota bacterium]